MKTVNDFLDDAKEKFGSDYAVAKKLNTTRQAVSNWRKRGSLDNENAFKLAELISEDPVKIIAAGEASRHPEKAVYWAKWGALAGVIMAIVIADIFSVNQTVMAATSADSVLIMRTAMVLIILLMMAWSYFQKEPSARSF